MVRAWAAGASVRPFWGSPFVGRWGRGRPRHQGEPCPKMPFAEPRARLPGAPSWFSLAPPPLEFHPSATGPSCPMRRGRPLSGAARWINAGRSRSSPTLASQVASRQSADVRRCTGWGGRRKADAPRSLDTATWDAGEAGRSPRCTVAAPCPRASMLRIVERSPALAGGAECMELRWCAAFVAGACPCRAAPHSTDDPPHGSGSSGTGSFDRAASAGDLVRGRGPSPPSVAAGAKIGTAPGKAAPVVDGTSAAANPWS